MAINSNTSFKFSDYLNKRPFNQAFPWIGGDLQTLRDTFIFDLLQVKTNKKILLPINNILSEKFEGDYLLGFLELPENFNCSKGIVLITCTKVEPAKSEKPAAANQPPPHCQPITIG